MANRRRRAAVDGGARSARAALVVAGLAAAAGAGPGAARAEEGFWTFDRFPADAVAQAYGFRPDAAWLDRARLGSVRLAGGCSAALVSAAGLLATNQHCVADCLQDLSTPGEAGRDLLRDGFLAASAAEERRCPGLAADLLVALEDVTARVEAAVAARPEGGSRAEAERSARAAAEAGCGRGAADDGDGERCEVQGLDEGARQVLHRYHRFGDVRLVMAPESAVALFGGEDDNFEFPRHAFDVAFLRLYEGGAPAATPDHLPLAGAPLRSGDLTFVSGHPVSTNRHETAAQLEFRRDVVLPQDLPRLAALRDVLAAFQDRGPEQRRVAMADLRAVENTLKAMKGRAGALRDGPVVEARRAAEAGLRALAGDGPFEAIAEALARYRSFRLEHVMLEGGQGFRSRLFGHARGLLRTAGERAKPAERRLPEYADGRLGAATRELLAELPVSRELERATLAWSLAALRDALGPDHLVVRKALADEPPDALAARLVDGTRLDDPAVRRRLLEGGEPAVEASDDPMLLFARAVDLHARLVRARYEIGVEAVLAANAARIARARIAALGDRAYPDATASLRLSYGAVRGYVEPSGRVVGPFTTLAGAFRRHTGREPLALPGSWLAARDALNPGTALGFATTNDVVGGSSGSPVLNRAGELVGLVFDSNVHALGGELWYDEALSRAVSLSTVAIREVLAKVYKADRLLAELGG